MPTYEIQAPNGQSYQIEGPDGATDEEIRAEVLRQFPEAAGGGRKASSPANSPSPTSNVPPNANAKSVVEALFPGVRVTDWKRDPNSDLGRANPGSWHNHSGAAIDIAPIPGMTYEEASKRFQDAGFDLIEDIDEVKTPSGHATGPHWHFVLSQQKPGFAPVGEPPVPAPPGSPEAPPPTEDLKLATMQTPPTPEGDSYSWDSIKQGLAQGAGNIVEGAADIPGMVVDPVNTALFRALGYNGYTSDFGKSAREALGLPEDDSLMGNIAKGAVGGFTGSLAARGLAKLGTGVVSKSFAEMGATPFRDAVAGAGGSAGSELAERAGLGPTGQIIAGLAGGVAGYGASGIPKHITPDARATRFATKEAQRNPNAAFDAEVARDIAKAARAEGISARAASKNPELVTKVLNNIEGGYVRKFPDLINQSELSAFEKLKLKEALENRYSIMPEDLDQIRGTVQGDAVADGILKVQSMRRLTEPHGRTAGALSKTLNTLGLAHDGLSLVVPYPGNTLVSRAISGAARNTSDQEMARIAQAKKIISKQKGYEKLSEIVGPSGHADSRQAMWNATEDFLNNKEVIDGIGTLGKAKANAWSAKAKMSGEMTPKQRTSTEEAAWKAKQAEEAAVMKAKAAQEEAMWSQVEPVPVKKGDTNAEISDWNNVLKIAQDRQKAKTARLKATTPNVSFEPPKPPKPPKPVKEPKPPKPPKPDPIQDAIDDAVSKGLKGDSRVQESFANSLGVKTEDLPALLDNVATDVPALAGEIERIKLGHPTRNKLTGTALRPHLRSAMEKLGITPAEKAAPEATSAKPAAVPVDDAAQARLEASPPKPMVAKEQELLAELDKVDPVQASFDDGVGVRASQAGMLDPASAQRSAEIQEELKKVRAEVPDQNAPANMRRISRPAAHAAGTARRISQADDAIQGFLDDGNIHPQTKSIMGMAPRQLKENFSYRSEAEKFLHDSVLPDLEANGVPKDEISKVKSHMYDIIWAKKYGSEDEFNAGLYTGKPGRPPKPKP